jgi:hypothetical protein
MDNEDEKELISLAQELDVSCVLLNHMMVTNNVCIPLHSVDIYLKWVESYEKFARYLNKLGANC